jgi:hypothetical protein
MARAATDQTEQTERAAERSSGPRARQGQNIRGMLTVLLVSIGLVAVAYGAMLAFGTAKEEATTTPGPAPEVTSPANPAANPAPAN